MLDNSKLKNLKLIVSDLDGTLLNDEGRIGSKSIELIDRLKSQGVRFSFASGRLHSAILEYANTLNISSPLISLDGSLIKSNGNKIIYESYVPERYVRKAIELADYNVLKIALCHADAIYFTEYNSLIPELLNKFGAKYVEVNSYDNYIKNTLEIVIVGDHKDSIKRVEKQMTFPYTFGLSTSFYKSHNRGNIYYFEVRKHGVDKGKGVKRLGKYLNVKMSQTAVLGDWYNDRLMFKSGALKIAIANAVPEIIKLADYVTKKDNSEDGTAEFFEMVLKAKES